MIGLIRDKVNDLLFNGSANAEELRRIMGAAQFAFAKLSRRSTPPYDEFFNAIQELAEVDQKYPALSDKATFDGLKSGALKAIDKLNKSLTDRGLEESDSMAVIMRGQKTVDMEEEVEFALLLVEQKHLNYFRDRASHLPSQPHDRLYSHYIIVSSSGRSQFFFPEGTILPEYIQNDAVDAVKKVAEKYHGKW